MKNTIFLRLTTIILFVLTVGAVYGLSQTADFTYQGRLLDSSFAANGNYDFQFALYDSQSNGNFLGTVTRSNVTVSSGIFTVRLDFPTDVFDGTDRFLEIGVKPTGGPNAYTVLAPRQPITSAPYSIRSVSASTADLATNSTQLGGLPSDGFIHNGTSQQGGTDFNISGNGTAAGTLSGGSVNSGSSYQIGNSRVLAADGNANTFVGLFAGQDNTSGSTDTFVGYFAGKANTTGFNNSYLGWGAGSQGTAANNNAFFGTGAGNVNTASFNSFFGSLAGFQNTTGTDNSFFGTQAGTANTTGSSNSFFGRNAGASNTTGASNSFFGQSAGRSANTNHDNTFIGSSAGANTLALPGGINYGSFNTFVGSLAGASNTTGFTNSFFGYNSGAANTTGDSNTFFGYEAGMSDKTECCNSFFGSLAGEKTTGGSNSFFGSAAGAQNTTGQYNSAFGFAAGSGNTTGSHNTLFGTNAGNVNLTGNDNSFFGMNSGHSSRGSSNTAIGLEADSETNVNNGTALGAHAMVTQDNSLVLGGINGINNATADTSVGIGTTAPKATFHVATNSGNFLIGGGGCNSGYIALGFGSALNCTNYSLLSNGTDTVINRTTGGSIYFMLNGVQQGGITPAGDLYSLNKIGLGSLGSAGSTALCRNASNQISTCSSSLRYKKDLHPFTSGLSLIRQLNPITFRWKADNMLDLGFGAEDIAKVEPLLVTHNASGQVEGVKYDRISAVLVNAVKEQQTQIETQQNQIRQQQALIDGLKNLVCRNKKRAAVCRQSQKGKGE